MVGSEILLASDFSKKGKKVPHMSSWFTPSLGSIRYVSAECSRGKTLAACEYMAQKLIFNNFLYVAPTKKLLQQTFATLQGMGVRPTLIDSDTTPKRVNAAIISYLKEAPDGGAVLLVTWNAYESLTYFHRPEDWVRIIDEVPQLDAFHPFTLPYNHHFLTDNIEISRTINDKIVEVAPKHRGALKRLLEKPHDDVHDHFRPLFLALLSKHKTVYLDANSWTRIAEKQIVSEQDEKEQNLLPGDAETEPVSEFHPARRQRRGKHALRLVETLPWEELHSRGGNLQ